MSKTLTELQRIVTAGGGIRIDASSRTPLQLVKLAGLAAASPNKPMIFLHGVDAKTTNELVQIAAAGCGRVVFEFAT